MVLLNKLKEISKTSLIFIIIQSKENSNVYFTNIYIISTRLKSGLAATRVPDVAV